MLLLYVLVFSTMIFLICETLQSQ
jgi:Serine carboxypeptidase